MDASDRNLLSVFTPQSFFDDSPTLARNNHSSTLDSASESIDLSSSPDSTSDVTVTSQLSPDKCSQLIAEDQRKKLATVFKLDLSKAEIVASRHVGASYSNPITLDTSVDDTSSSQRQSSRPEQVEKESEGVFNLSKTHPLLSPQAPSSTPNIPQQQQ